MASQTILTASGVVVKQGMPAKYRGYEVIVATATGAINIRDGGSSGTIRAVIPASTALGSSKNYAEPIAFNDGVYAEFNGGATGTVGFLAD